MEVSLVVITGRDKNNFDRFIKTLKLMTVKPTELIIVYDMKNAKFDECFNPKQNYDLEIKVKSYEYHGLNKQPGMRNLALKNCNSKYIWFVDDDISFFEDSYLNLLKLLEDVDNLNIASIGCKIIEEKDFDKSKLIKPIECNMLKGPIGLFDLEDNEFPFSYYETINGKSGKKYPIVPFCQGTSMVYNVKILKDLGGFDEDLGYGYASYEDSEVGFALSNNKKITIYSSMSKIIHHKLLRVNGDGRGNENYDYNKFLVRNHIISILKNNYKSKLSKYFYAFAFPIIQLLRCIKSNILYKKTILEKSFSVFICFYKIVNGIFLGMKAYLTNKRINNQ